MRRRHTGERVAYDYNETCIDEVHGVFLAALPLWFIEVAKWPRVGLLVAAFALFRLFDAKKPWLIGKLERRLEGSTIGIMLDDTAAGLVAAVAVGIAAKLIG